MSLKRHIERGGGGAGGEGCFNINNHGRLGKKTKKNLLFFFFGERALFNGALCTRRLPLRSHPRPLRRPPRLPRSPPGPGRAPGRQLGPARGSRGPVSLPAAMSRGSEVRSAVSPSGSVPRPPPAGLLRRGARLRRRRHFLSSAPGRFPRGELPAESRRPPRCPLTRVPTPSRPAAGSPGCFPLPGARRRRAPHTGAGPRAG